MFELRPIEVVRRMGGTILVKSMTGYGRAEETVAELFRRVRYRPSSMTGPNGHNGDNEESKKEKKNHAHQVSKASKMVVFDL